MKVSKAFVVAAITLGCVGALRAQSPWQGWYLGGNAGYVMDQSNVTTNPEFSPTGYFASSSTPAIAASAATEINPTGFAVTVDAGWNGTSGSLAYGGEMDLGFVSASKERSAGAVYPCCAPTAYTIDQKVSESFKSSFRGRLGWANSKWIVYGTGGLALSNFKYEEVFNDNFAAAHESDKVSKTKLGWIIGVGTERVVRNNWSLKGEYLYSNFGEITGTSDNLTAFSPPISFPSNVFHNSADLKSGELRFGFNYRF